MNTTPTPIPAEPPVDTMVRDRHGAIHRRYADGWGEEFDRSHHLGVWTAIWEARGPLVEVTKTQLIEERAIAAEVGLWDPDEWEEKWRRVARRPLGPTDEAEAFRIARYALVGRTPLDAAEATQLAAATLRLLAEVGRAGLNEED